MRNKFLYIASALLLAATATSCREENTLLIGEGKMTLTTSVMSEIKVVSRSLTDEQKNELASSALIWVTDPASNLLYKFNGLSSFPAEGLPLSTGSYLAHAWVGDSVPASWDKIRYHGWQPFDIAAGAVTPVNVKCPVRNALVSVNLGGKIADVLSDVTFTVSLNDGITDGSHSLTFDSEKIGNGTKGYFMPNSRTEGFIWTINATDNHGNPFTYSGEYKDEAVESKPNLAHSTEYVFNINYDYEEDVVELGGAYLDIDVQPEPIEGETTELVIALAPEIVGLDGFDINKDYLGEPGAVGRVSIHVIGATALKEVHFESEALKNINGNSYNRLDLLYISESLKNTLKAGGVNINGFDNRAEKVDGEYTNLRINLEEEFTNSLPSGDYMFTVEALDVDNHRSVKTFTIKVTNAPGQLTEMSAEELDKAVSYTSATISANIKTPGSVMGFEVKTTGAARAYEDWTFVPGTLGEDGKTLSATLTDLQDNTTYVYRLVVDEYTSANTLTFCTRECAQLPNNSFEEWSTSGKVTIPGVAGSFWDSGNHGSATMGVNITSAGTEYKHSGSYSAKLRSQFVGVMGIGKFAAGNIFAGAYLYTDGTDGELGWGRSFTETPKAVTVWARYEPGTVVSGSNKGSGDHLSVGDKDQGIIYCALMDDNTYSYTTAKSDYNGTSWPVIVKTKSSNRQLFDPAGEHVIAYGEHVFESATSGDGLVQITIPIDYLKSGKRPSYIVFVASASRYGDYFEGGEGSTLWIDDIELVY